jgi:hypothetical protein
MLLKIIYLQLLKKMKKYCFYYFNIKTLLILNKMEHYTEIIVLLMYLMVLETLFLLMYLHFYFKNIIINNNMQLEIGCICIVDMRSWGFDNVNDSNCPWKSGVALIIILEKKRNSYYKCEYYDRLFGTRDTIKIHSRYIKPLLKVSDITNDTNILLNNYLIKEREMDSVEAGSHKDTEGHEFRIPVSKGGVPRNIEKYNQRMEMILLLIINDNITQFINSFFNNFKFSNIFK